jgi:hypothetical protein
MSDKSGLYSLKLAGGGLSIDREITEELASQIAMFVISGGKAELSQADGGQPGLSTSTQGSGAIPTDKSPQEYLQQSGAKKIPQKMTALGHYVLGTQKGKKSFSQDELKGALEDAKEKVPANFNRDLSAAIKRGWVARVTGEKDAYYVTGTGIAAINQQFPHSKKKRKKKKKAAAKSK